MNDVYLNISRLIKYAIGCGILGERDKIFATNALLEIMKLDDFVQCDVTDDLPLEQILSALIEDAVQRGVIEPGGVYADLYDTKLMSALLPPPSVVIDRFEKLYEQSPESATDWYYNFSKNSDYIREYRIKKDVKWTCDTPYGKLDITINLSKPEKDPRDIAAAKLAPVSGYPRCLLCAENEGYAGRTNHPARQNHRIIPIELENERWFLQYSPYVYYNEHCIVFKGSHDPMSITQGTFERLLEFVSVFPHYMVGSNADLPIVGGSILTHDHFQGGRYEFAMQRAAEINEFVMQDGVRGCTLVWPLSVLRLRHENREVLAKCAFDVFKKWQNYSDESVDIRSHSGDTPHNTVTPIARYRNGNYEMDLALRNNRTSQRHPMGIFHPHSELHHIKKENIGLIEVMGLAVLPGRLKHELQVLRELIESGQDLYANELTSSHAEWAYDFMEKNKDCTDIEALIDKEVGLVFMKVLEDAGVFKQTSEGKVALGRFIDTLKIDE